MNIWKKSWFGKLGFESMEDPILLKDLTALESPWVHDM
jgi:hypothetical protein